MATEEETVALTPDAVQEDSVDEATPLHRWIRIFLLILTAPWIVVFAIACGLDPYENNGEAKRLGTHRQILLPGMDEGLPDCNFKVITGVPCPSCGMTTSFTLLIRADVWNSLQANFAGTALAAFGLLFVPWAFASAFFGRFVFIRSMELVIFRLAVIFLFLLFGRWALVLIWELFIK